MQVDNGGGGPGGCEGGGVLGGLKRAVSIFGNTPQRMKLRLNEGKGGKEEEAEMGTGEKELMKEVMKEVMQENMKEMMKEAMKESMQENMKEMMKESMQQMKGMMQEIAKEATKELKEELKKELSRWMESCGDKGQQTEMAALEHQGRALKKKKS